MNEAINRACEMVGGVGKLAALVGVAPPTVTQWCKGSRPVPPRKAVRIESATERRVTRQDMFPHDYHEIWPELAGSQPAVVTAQAGV